MFCSNCGKEIADNKKFCGHCGTKLNLEDANKKTLPIISTCIVILFLIGLITFAGFSIINNENGLSSKVQKTMKNPSKILTEIDEYQAKYWEIAKRHNILLAMNLDDNLELDQKELNTLFKAVENKIDKNNYYLEKYHEIDKKYAKNPGMNTVEMNEFASKYYWEVDGLLNEVYQAVKQKISRDDFGPLIKSELKWLKDVKDYDDVFEEQGYGSIRTIIYFDYQINMRSFRTLLLMLYL